MERILTRLERRFGRLAIPNLIGLIVGGMAIVFVLTLLKPAFEGRLALVMSAVRRGEVWRLVTFLFIPPQSSPGSSPIWLLISLYFTWWLGSSLEKQWGAFKFNAYYFVGMLAAIAAAAVEGVGMNYWLDFSLLFAFASVFPDVQVLLFFVVPVRIKWTGIAAAVYMAYSAYVGDGAVRASIAAAVATYLLFFGGFWVDVFKSRSTLAHQRSRLDAFRNGGPGVSDARESRESVRPSGERTGFRAPAREVAPSAAPVFGQRVCAICGAEEADGADIRVCSCEKCGSKQRALCLVHARNH
jgi:hypothetical protein